MNDDAQLIQATRRGDSQAFGQLVRKYQNRVFNVVRHVVGDHQDAEDLVQETFVQALVKIESFQGTSAFYTWLYRIAFNLSVSFRRRRRPEVSVDQRRETSGTEPSDRGDGPEERLARQERVGQVQSALASLSEEYRTILVLREIDGCDYDTLGEILDLPIGTVRSRLHRARTELRERLRDMLQETPAERT